MKRVLIVDDAMFMRLSIKTMLQKNGYEVVGEAADGNQAVTQFQTLQPDIVTMDITMPNSDGVTALKQIKAIDQNATVLMITALGHENSVREAIMAGAKGFVVKPFEEATLVKALAKL